MALYPITQVSHRPFDNDCRQTVLNRVPYTAIITAVETALHELPPTAS